jgi:hypothetical protein
VTVIKTARARSGVFNASQVDQANAAVEAARNGRGNSGMLSDNLDRIALIHSYSRNE